MSLRYALLAILTAAPLTGYETAKRFEGSVGHVWHAPDSQIYPELRRMETEGLVQGREERWGPNSTKTRYYITAEGESAFRGWMSEPLRYAPWRDVAHMQAAYFEWTDPDSVRMHLQQHAQHYEEQIAQWSSQVQAIESHEHPMIAARLQRYPAEQHARIVAFKSFAYEGLIRLAQAEVDWANSGLALLEELEAQDAEGAG
ncbi:PadR family transcriptional regulator [Nesterenkonia lutea]|uniref:DNA-binding PadR family transcriptional regulator n=1 Tax=Nesterenkonia lutea TaxID=272919 RepID=A0ABR9JBG4_9MICC|nr:helix-turn-helix transcriptional regulator [Nesterenkonia lutea]MBE1523265.1 DNA-binding PadR family transcriptional regulator [Nesterenkonia lutea]